MLMKLQVAREYIAHLPANTKLSMFIRVCKFKNKIRWDSSVGRAFA